MQTTKQNLYDNFDPEEVAQFEAAAAAWWDEQGAFAPLHAINPLRTDFISARSQLQGRAALDVGCGGGILCESLAARGARVTGIDVGEKAVAVAKLHALESGVAVEYLQTSAEALAAEINANDNGEARRWDVVCCLELLEHLPRPAEAVAACANLVKPSGDVFFSTINRNLKSFMMAIVAAEYVLGLLPRGTHKYEKLIRPSELQNWCEAAGLRVKEMIGLHFNPLTKNYFLDAGVEVNYFMHCVRD